MRGPFVGPLQAVSLGNSVVTQVKWTRCLCVEIDSSLNWNIYVKELIKSSSKKLNLLRSLYFLHTTERADFSFKVILQSVTHGLVVWGSCGKLLFDEVDIEDTCTCRKDHLWPGLVHTQRSGLSPKAIGPLLKIYANIDYFMLAHDCFYNFFTRSYYEAVYEIWVQQQISK